ncbi:DUF4145 domain-containing protein [Pelagibacterium lentulum]|uniref:DUF4145 domain-containing protein n=1 Tax=Pelagibacterium lentulum TaxID=2029865 RepID=A0A916VX47_9HYPH|nr:DUF4145 domain-containing protein [Pelagibacterium lentulum]GGA47277.1 hypothetical protein GCM10011499_16330 [Pelagibacterium lentulum]
MTMFISDCVRCGTKSVQHQVTGQSKYGTFDWEIMGFCMACGRSSIYEWDAPGSAAPMDYDGRLGRGNSGIIGKHPVRIATTAIEISEHVPSRIADLFREANECRQMMWYEAAGAMYRKTLDVATKHIYSHDDRLEGKQPAQALRVRIKSLGEMKILEPDIVELADVAALDGNDATHDVDPYTADEAEALEDLTQDLLDRLFVRPARLAAVKAKQITSGQRKAD